MAPGVGISSIQSDNQSRVIRSIASPVVHRHGWYPLLSTSPAIMRPSVSNSAISPTVIVLRHFGSVSCQIEFVTQDAYIQSSRPPIRTSSLGSRDAMDLFVDNRAVSRQRGCRSMLNRSESTAKQLAGSAPSLRFRVHFMSRIHADRKPRQMRRRPELL